MDLNVRRRSAVVWAVVGLVLLGPLAGVRTADAAPAGGPAGSGRFTGTARLPECSAAVVRWDASQEDDPAMVLTNGHCVRFPLLGARETLVDQRQWKRIELLDGAGRVALVVRGVHLAYATMHRTDLAVYELRESYADLERSGVQALTLATSGPRRGDRVRVPSGYWGEQRACHARGTTWRLHERAWDWRSSIRLPRGDGCAIRGGYSGAPVVDRSTNRVVGVVNTGYVGGVACAETACEENRHGDRRVRRGMEYAQQTWWLTTCVGTDRRLDLTVPGCRLPDAHG